MTIKKPAVKKAPAFNAVQVAKDTANYRAQGDSFTAKANESAISLHNYCKKTGIKVGTMKSDCAIMAGFVSVAETFYTNTKVLENLCSAFRKACNEGKVFGHNTNRKPSGAKTSKSAESAAVVRLTIVKDSDISEVAQGLREALEGKREQYAELVAFLIDAIDEFEGV
jgi:hypothetical protein